MQQVPLVEVIQFRGPSGPLSAMRNAAERAGKTAPDRSGMGSGALHSRALRRDAMTLGYGMPAVDFSPLGELGKVYREGKARPLASNAAPAALAEVDASRIGGLGSPTDGQGLGGRARR